MAEIKLNDSFLAEVQNFRVAGEELRSVGFHTPSTGDLSLPVVEAYQDRLRRIEEMIIRFGVLVNKDAEDMEALASKLKAADKTNV